MQAAATGVSMNMFCRARVSLLVLTPLALGGPVLASNINGINGGMPNRISMNVTVPKQTQGATFGEKVNAGLHAAGSALAQGGSRIVVECGQDACALLFPDGRGYRADTTRMTLQPLSEAQTDVVRSGAAPLAQRTSLLGGALPGGAIISAAVSSVGNLAGGAGGGAAAASYAATGRVGIDPTPLSSARGKDGAINVLDPLGDGDYLMTVVVEKATSGLKDTLKTQVRASSGQMSATPTQVLVAPQRVRIEVGFSVQAGMLKTKHDTAKNSVGNIR